MQVHDESLIHRLELDGFVHVWGSAGAGKTSFATLLAADFSRFGPVEWINADAKLAFINSLKLNIKFLGGNQQRVNVTLAKNHQDAKAAIFQLTKEVIQSPILCVIDPITRTLDLARNDPILWEQEFLERVLPAIAGFSRFSGTTIIATSECRAVGGAQSVPILHSALSKWADHELQIRRNSHRLITDIYRMHPSTREWACVWSMQLNTDGTLQFSERGEVNTSRRH